MVARKQKARSRHGQAEGVSIRELSVDYDTEGKTFRALSQVDLEIEPSEFVCLLGPSGCGKTTLLNVISGFVAPTTGTVRVGDEPARSPTLARGVVFQEYALFPWRTALRNVEFGMEVTGTPKPERHERAMEFLALVRLDTFAHAYPHELSGGMKQRVAIARALAYDPPLLLMDEPFGALDAFTRDELQQLLSDIWQKTGKTVVYVTHNISEAVFLADRVVVFEGNPGRIKDVLEVGLERPRNVFGTDFTELESRVTGLVHDAPDRQQQQPGRPAHTRTPVEGAQP
ncbi:ABC transporter ATP-binding protein [Pseudonocardia sp. MH-G8]|uniref:ABC transporter ATP-binding protein n=1 Tax=Pseudonocardia sp. MH-G8 TaxID=1854588 RepID=UPI000BA0C07F|nr:ABC transporter ATP-binding protein [Pseudonocardia sp. MH-G8]OZM77111.1 nitrate ABC transporter ATP-binding protein [Pseudonocardia sp. MH-G8]